MKLCLLVLLSAFVALTTADVLCGEGGHFDECGKPWECDPNCDDPNPPSDCLEICVERCVCFDGYYYNEEKCIRPRDCPHK